MLYGQGIGMNRIDIMNNIIQKYGYTHYLEIGVYVKSDCFDHINVTNKTAIDPGYENEHEKYDYKMESDTFFDNVRLGSTEFPIDKKWDLIFIDGLHLAEQVERDINNALFHLADGGTIVMHDCSPPHEIIARETYKANWVNVGEWCGTVWKAFYKFRYTRPDLAMWCVNDDYGVGIIQRGTQKLAPADNTFYEYKKFDSNREEYLNLIHPNEFLRLFGGVNV